MTRTNRTSRDEMLRETLRRALREGDPAADGRTPTPDETALLRARVLHAAREAAAPEGAPRMPAWGLRPATVLSAALLGIAVLVVAARAPWKGPVTAGRAGVLDGRADAGDPGGEAPRQIQFTTPGGTRVVWMLYPEDSTEHSEPSIHSIHRSRARRGPGGRS